MKPAEIADLRLLKKELAQAEDMLESNETTYRRDYARYFLFKKEWEKRRKAVKQKIMELIG